MDLLDGITDSSDFPIDSLRKLDTSLRCTICKEFFDGPVILHCGHTFCSLCIRSVLQIKAECPTCRAAAKESHLVRNAMFEEAVSTWSDARPVVLKFAKESVQPRTASPVSSRGKKRKLSHNSEQTPGSEVGPSKVPRRGSSEPRDAQFEEEEESAKEEERPRKNRRHRNEGEVVPSSDPEEQELPNPARINPPIECPVCSCQVPYNSINAHIDGGCKTNVSDDSGGTPKAGGSARRDSKAVWGSIFNGQGKKTSGTSSAKDSEIPTTKIAKVSYGVLNLAGLRKLLAEKGLPTNGDEDELIARHKKWTAIFNANLDRTQPKTVGELKRRLKELEEVASRPGTKKVQDDKAWTRKNKAQFASLIETARPKAKCAGEVKITLPLSPRPQPSTSSSSSSVPNGAGTSSDVIVLD